MTKQKLIAKQEEGRNKTLYLMKVDTVLVDVVIWRL